MSTEIIDPRFAAIVASGSERELISDEFNFIEGPIWHPVEHHLTFSDIPEDKLYRYMNGNLSVVREPSNMANGNTYDRQGRMLSCEHATSQVRRDENGVMKVIASHYDGKELNSPNDIVVATDGTIYFTDPTYGRLGRHGLQRDLQLDFRGVYRIDPDGALALLVSDFEQPNGLCLSLDEGWLYVADTTNRHVRKFALTNGNLSGGEVFCESPAPDGLKIDSLGNLYAGGPAGVYVYDRNDAALLGVFQTPQFCANFAWGDQDLRTLYLTASTSLFRLRVEVPGLALF